MGAALTVGVGVLTATDRTGAGAAFTGADFVAMLFFLVGVDAG